MQRLKTTEVAAARRTLLVEQGNVCDLCRLQCSEAQAVLDHNHSTGAVRATLHRGCNALLGKVENNAARYGVPNVSAFGAGLGPYLARHMTNKHGLLHPTFKTEDEKRLLRNKRARVARAKKVA
jgi:hypothetical protein